MIAPKKWPEWLEIAMKDMTEDEKQEAIRIYKTSLGYQLNELKHEIIKALHLEDLVNWLNRFIKCRPKLWGWIEISYPILHGTSILLCGLLYSISFLCLLFWMLGYHGEI